MFLGSMSLLENAEKNSSVFTSIPYLTDKYVIDQLCRFSKQEYGGLQFYIILGPKSFDNTFLNGFIKTDNEVQIREVLSRLHIDVFGTDDDSLESHFSHSNGMVSTAGAMIGSYNYTAKARLCHLEHAVLLAPDCEATQMLRAELMNGWNAIQSDEISFPAPPKREAPTGGATDNPYAKMPKTNRRNMRYDFKARARQSKCVAGFFVKVFRRACLPMQCHNKSAAVGDALCDFILLIDTLLSLSHFMLKKIIAIIYPTAIIIAYSTSPCAVPAPHRSVPRSVFSCCRCP